MNAALAAAGIHERASLALGTLLQRFTMSQSLL